MKIDFVAPHFKLSERQRDYIKKKIESLKKFAQRVADESTRAKVEFREQKLKTAGTVIYCEVTVYVPKAVIRAEVKASKVEEAIDLAEEKLKKQIERYKAKMLRRRDKKGDWIATADLPEMPDLPDFSQDFPAVPRVTKRKAFSHITPMHEEEAVEQMELIGHDFFLFLNRDTGRYSVVYRREDGTYGTIEPKVQPPLKKAKK